MSKDEIVRSSKMLRLLESYLVRRNVCRLTTKNYNSLFIQMTNRLKEVQKAEGGN